jgi:hypothetical protein
MALLLAGDQALSLKAGEVVSNRDRVDAHGLRQLVDRAAGMA